MPKPTKKKRDLPPGRTKLSKIKAATGRPKKARKLKSGAGAHPLAGETERASAAVLDRLWRIIEERQSVAPAHSHSARLLARGTRSIVQKLGEEQVELMIEAVAGNRSALVLESADVLYHLLIVWMDAGIRPDEVWSELERRETVSRGLRIERLGTTKIP